MRRLWVTWEKQRRNRSASKALQAELAEIITSRRRIIRYFISAKKTIEAISKQKPQLLFVQNPSLVLSTLAILLRPLFSYKVIIDAHNTGLRPKEGKSKFLMGWARWIIKNADLIIVTNEILLEYVNNSGGNGAVLPDPLPDLIEPTKTLKLKGQNNLLFVCSWADDEPISAVVDAARIIDTSICIYITGRWQNQSQLSPAATPDNIVLTGFLTEREYDSMLFSCDAILVLTNRPDCLVCGAYEGIAAGKPLILSDTPALRHYFNRATVFTNNTADEIAESIKSALGQKTLLLDEAFAFREDLPYRWSKYLKIIELKLLEL